MLGKKKRTENTEIDLVAFISLLSVCICFLLLTTIWIQIGSMNVKQAIGGQAVDSSKPKPSLWVIYEKDGDIRLQFKDSPRKVVRKFGRMKIAGVDGKPDLEKISLQLVDIKAQLEDISMALIRPVEKTAFEDIISVMDVFRDKGFQDLGVTPI